MKILVFNPGSTSTKIAVFHAEKSLFGTTVRHPDDKINSFKRVAHQYEYRLLAVEEALSRNGHSMADFSALAARGGLLRPLEGGTYLIDSEMVSDLTACRYGEHASNLGAIMAYNLAGKYGIGAYTVDPVSVDEMHDPARYSGLPEIPRVSQSHALNLRAAAREAACRAGVPLDRLNLIVVHLGSGISVAAFEKGKMIDVNNANNEGPFSIERCGGLPSTGLARLCYSGSFSQEEMIRKLNRTGGIFAYLGTRDFGQVETMVREGNHQARKVVLSMCYQVAKEIGAMWAALCGRVDGIVLTGGMAHSAMVVDEIAARVSTAAGITVMPGEMEMEALALGVLRVLRGEETVKYYGRGIPGGNNDRKFSAIDQQA